VAVRETINFLPPCVQKTLREKKRKEKKIKQKEKETPDASVQQQQEPEEDHGGQLLELLARVPPHASLCARVRR
jgi:hypothetical protein